MAKACGFICPDCGHCCSNVSPMNAQGVVVFDCEQGGASWLDNVGEAIGGEIYFADVHGESPPLTQEDLDRTRDEEGE